MINDLCEKIIIKFNIELFVETGTFVGETIIKVSEWFEKIDQDFGTIVERKPNNILLGYFPRRKLSYPIFKASIITSCKKIYSIDIDAKRQEILKGLFATNPNIEIIIDSSDAFLKKAIDTGVIPGDKKVLFYLDAHWGKYWPLRDEIREVLKRKQAIIVIDDFLVPYHPFHGFDAYKTEVCGWYHVNDLFTRRKTDVFYPKDANMDKRGSVIIFVDYPDKELEIMKTLPAFRPLFFKGAPIFTIAIKSVLFILVITGLYSYLVLE